MPHEKVREENRKKVIEKTFELFVNNSVERTTIDMIAKEVGITVRSIQNYFATKEELIQAVFTDHIAIQKKNLDEMVNRESYKAMSGMDQIRHIVENSIRHAVDDPAYVCCFWKLKQHIANMNETSGAEYGAENELVENQISLSIAKGKKDGSIKESAFAGKNDAKLIVLMLAGMRSQLAFFAMSESLAGQYPTAELAEETIKAFEKISANLFGE